MDVFQNKVATELFIFSFYEEDPGQADQGQVCSLVSEILSRKTRIEEYKLSRTQFEFSPDFSPISVGKMKTMRQNDTQGWFKSGKILDPRPLF